MEEAAVAGGSGDDEGRVDRAPRLSSESIQSQIASSPLIVNLNRIQYGLSVTPSSSMQSWA